MDDVEKVKPSKFSLSEAVILMLDLHEGFDFSCDEVFSSGEPVTRVYWTFGGIGQACYKALKADIVKGDGHYSLMGFVCSNPFNYLEVDDVFFPREAYYQWWKDKERGLSFPTWFEDLRKADESHCFDSVESVNEAGINEGVQAVDGYGCFDKAIRLGRSTLRVLELIQTWIDRPANRKGSETEWRKTLFDSIEFNAKKEGWGLHADGGLSEKQWKAIELIFLPEPMGSGRGSKSWGGKYSFNDLKAK